MQYDWRPKINTCPKCGTMYGLSVKECPKCNGNLGMSIEVEKCLNNFRKGKLGLTEKQFGKTRP